MIPRVPSDTPPPTMVIDCDNFWLELPGVLEAICTAHYISYDLEMTGIVGEAVQSVPERPQEDAYRIARSAASTFQILQMGITCFSYDTDIQQYRSRTYSIHLTPFFAKYSDDLARLIDRKMTFSYKTFLFLEQHDFSFQKAFARGVPYLSRAEELKAAQGFLTHSAERGYDSRLDMNTLDPLTKIICDRARTQISSWLEVYPNYGQYVVIKTLTIATQEVKRRLNNALMQLVSSEFQDCYVNFHQGEAMVYKWEPKQRQRWEEERKTREAVLERQVAFRHIFEAFVGGSFASKINIQLVFPANHELSATERIDMKKKLQRLEKKRRDRPPVILGHNQFLDLCFMYQTFVGDLPATLAEFQMRARSLWPRLVDTKHMALEFGFRREMDLGKLHKALLESKDSFTLKSEVSSATDLLCVSDETNVAAHDAGYDSWMTAIVFGNLVKKALGRQDTRNQSMVLIPFRNISNTDPFSVLNPFGGQDQRTVTTRTQSNGIKHNGLVSNPERFIPRWEDEDGKAELWKQFGGKLRVGAAGVLDLNSLE